MPRPDQDSESARREHADGLLRALQRHDARRERARLRLFLGACPGVGKTVAMLEDAKARAARGQNVLVGLVETHGRRETSEHVGPLPQLPRRRVDYRGIVLDEFDLDGALQRRPDIVLVDELPHTNAPGSRNAKRWQDVVELLDAGIEVWTTVNVQHLESMHDVVAQVTGISVAETVPDGVLDRADEVVLIDASPETLLDRLRTGKIYAPDVARRAEQQFFKVGNLLALRELALRCTACRVDDEVQAYRQDAAVAGTWAVHEHVLVCVSAAPTSRAVVRAARRLADGLKAPWTALAVDVVHSAWGHDNRARVAGHLAYAESLGGQSRVAYAQTAADGIMALAGELNATRVVVGRPTHPRWRDRAFGSLIDDVVRRSQGLEVHVVRTDPAPAETTAAPKPHATDLRPWFEMLVVVALATVVAAAIDGILPFSQLIMVYLLGMVVVAVRCGSAPSWVAAGLSVAAFDFCFVPPRGTFAVSDVRYLLTFAVMFVVGIVVSGLTDRLRRQVIFAQQRERHVALQATLTRELAAAARLTDVAELVAGPIEQQLGTPLRLVETSGNLVACSKNLDVVWSMADRGRAVWSAERGERCGRGTQHLADGDWTLLPVALAGQTLAVLAAHAKADRQRDPADWPTLEAMTGQLGQALARIAAAEQAASTERRAERQELLNTMLSAVSHDLRTPLAALAGSIDTLARTHGDDGDLQQTLLASCRQQIDQMDMQIHNLLEMSRIETGELRLHTEWNSLEELVGTALQRCERLLGGRPVNVQLPPDLPLVNCDARAIEQVIVNIIENACKYSAAGQALAIAAWAAPGRIELAIADEGPGFEPGDLANLADRFFRGTEGRARGGFGLGLAICRALLEAHRGSLTFGNQPKGGARVTLSLPLEPAPAVPAIGSCNED